MKKIVCMVAAFIMVLGCMTSAMAIGQNQILSKIESVFKSTLVEQEGEYAVSTNSNQVMVSKGRLETLSTENLSESDLETGLNQLNAYLNENGYMIRNYTTSQGDSAFYCNINGLFDDNFVMVMMFFTMPSPHLELIIQ